MDAQSMLELNKNPNADTVYHPMADIAVCGSETKATIPRATSVPLVPATNNEIRFAVFIP